VELASVARVAVVALLIAVAVVAYLRFARCWRSRARSGRKLRRPGTCVRFGAQV